MKFMKDKKNLGVKIIFYINVSNKRKNIEEKNCKVLRKQGKPNEPISKKNSFKPLVKIYLNKDDSIHKSEALKR